MTIRFPQVHIDNKQLVYVSFSIEGKRIRSSRIKRRRYAYGEIKKPPEIEALISYLTKGVYN